MDKFALKVQKGLISKVEADRRRQQANGVVKPPPQQLKSNVVVPKPPKKAMAPRVKASKLQFNMSAIPSMSVNPTTGTVTVKATDIWTTVDFVQDKDKVIAAKTGEVGVNPTILKGLNAFKSSRSVRFVGLRITWAPVVRNDKGTFALCVTSSALVDKSVYNIANVSNGRVGSISEDISVDANFATYNNDWYAYDQVFRYISFWASSNVAGPCGLLKISYVIEINNADAVPKPLKLVDDLAAVTFNLGSTMTGTGSSSGFTVDQLEQMLAQARIAEGAGTGSSSGAGVGGSSNDDQQTTTSTVDSTQGTGKTTA